MIGSGPKYVYQTNTINNLVFHSLNDLLMHIWSFLFFSHQKCSFFLIKNIRKIIQLSSILCVFIWMQELVGFGTEELNLKGKIVVPGFIDSHVHLIPGGLQVWQKFHLLNRLCFKVCVLVIISRFKISELSLRRCIWKCDDWKMFSKYFPLSQTIVLKHHFS